MLELCCCKSEFKIFGYSEHTFKTDVVFFLSDLFLIDHSSFELICIYLLFCHRIPKFFTSMLRSMQLTSLRTTILLLLWSFMLSMAHRQINRFVYIYWVQMYECPWISLVTSKVQSLFEVAAFFFIHFAIHLWIFLLPIWYLLVWYI